MTRALSGGLVAVVPVKPFAFAKQRLAPVLSPEARARLARAMLEDVLAVLAEVPELAGVLIVSAEPEAGRIAAAHGAGLLAEEGERGLNTALEQAARHVAGLGAAGLLVIPGDVPGVRAGEVSRLIAGHRLAGHREGAGVSLVAAHDGRGTNALLATPPDAIGFAFGADSFPAHRERARAAGLPVLCLGACEMPGLAHDIDTPDDLARLRALPGTSRSREVAVAEGISLPQY